MKANELRIGNLIQTDEGIETVIGITDEFIDCVLNGASGDYHIDDLYFNPIQLTEDWLLKFGFEDAHYGEYKKDRYTLDCEYTDKGIYYFIIDETCLELDVKHVHQLQNLYHALTGEELIYNIE